MEEEVNVNNYSNLEFVPKRYNSVALWITNPAILRVDGCLCRNRRDFFCNVHFRQP